MAIFKDHFINNKEYIIETARQLFSDCGYFGVSMNEIAKKINLTKAALYYHFDSKNEIYREVINKAFDDLRLSIKKGLNQKTTENKLEELIRNYLKFGLKEKNLIRILMLKPSSIDSRTKKKIIGLRKKIKDLIQLTIEKIIQKEKTDFKIDREIITPLLISIMNGLILEYSFSDKKIDLEKTPKDITKLLLYK
jgi:AcrR family transcriptional regulator